MLNKMRLLNTLLLLTLTFCSMSLHGCGGQEPSQTTVSVSNANTQIQQAPAAGDVDEACDQNCQVDCGPGGFGFAYRLVCGTTEAPTSFGLSDVVPNAADLPAVCQDRPLPECEEVSPSEEADEA